jgi:hypothetical protein
MFGRKRPDWSEWLKTHQESNPSKRMEVRQKLRESRLGKVIPNFNPIACQRIDEYGKRHGYNFQHALNGGEVRVIGYSLDGYDKEKNAVIEFYEKRHLRKKERDESRKKEIIKYLNCKFIELRE